MNFTELTNDFPRPWLKYYDAETPKNIDYYDSTMFRMFENTCRENPEKICLDYMNVKITYSRVYEEVCGCMRALNALGIRSGDRVSICLPNLSLIHI